MIQLRLLFAATLVISIPSLSLARITLTAPDVTVFYSDDPQQGTFEVFLDSTEPSPPTLSLHQVQLNLSPADEGVSFVSVDKPEIHPYAFSDFEPATNFANKITGGKTIDVGDILLTGLAPLDDDDGLFKVTFQVAGGTPPGTFDLAIASDPLLTALQDAQSNPIPFEIQSGAIHIVPEPTAMQLSIIAILGLAIFGCLRRRRVSPATAH